MYNAEVATLNIRGLTGSLFQFMVVIGGVVTVSFFGIPGLDWKQGFLVPGYLGLFVGVAAWACPESPRYLVDRYGKERARPALQRVRQGDVSEELDYIDSCLHEERKAGKVSYVELFTKPGLRFRLFVACYLQAAQQMTGVNAFLGFQTDIFHAAGYQSDQIDKFPDGPAMITQWVFIVGAVTATELKTMTPGWRSVHLYIALPQVRVGYCHFSDFDSARTFRDKRRMYFAGLLKLDRLVFATDNVN
jgi:SP family myo-inositol transporter-like MFS transporter 13